MQEPNGNGKVKVPPHILAVGTCRHCNTPGAILRLPYTNDMMQGQPILPTLSVIAYCRMCHQSRTHQGFRILIIEPTEEEEECEPEKSI